MGALLRYHVESSRSMSTDQIHQTPRGRCGKVRGYRAKCCKVRGVSCKVLQSAAKCVGYDTKCCKVRGASCKVSPASSPLHCSLAPSTLLPDHPLRCSPAPSPLHPCAHLLAPLRPSTLYVHRNAWWELVRLLWKMCITINPCGIY